MYLFDWVSFCSILFFYALREAQWKTLMTQRIMCRMRVYPENQMGKLDAYIAFISEIEIECWECCACIRSPWIFNAFVHNKRVVLCVLNTLIYKYLNWPIFPINTVFSILHTPFLSVFRFRFKELSNLVGCESNSFRNRNEEFFERENKPTTTAVKVLTRGTMHWALLFESSDATAFVKVHYR